MTDGRTVAHFKLVWCGQCLLFLPFFKTRASHLLWSVLQHFLLFEFVNVCVCMCCFFLCVQCGPSLLTEDLWAADGRQRMVWPPSSASTSSSSYSATLFLVWPPRSTSYCSLCFPPLPPIMGGQWPLAMDPLWSEIVQTNPGCPSQHLEKFSKRMLPWKVHSCRSLLWFKYNFTKNILQSINQKELSANKVRYCWKCRC